MRRIFAAEALILLLIGGCGPSFQIDRMHTRWRELRSEDRLAEAERVAEEMRTLANATYGATDPEAFDVSIRLAQSMAQLGDDEAARPLAESVVRDMRAAWGNGDPRLAQGLDLLVLVHLEARRWADADAAMEEIIPLCLEPFVDDFSKPGCRFIFTHKPASVFEQTGSYEKAVYWLDRHEALPSRLGGRAFAEGSLQHQARVRGDGGFYPEAIWYLVYCMEIALPRYERPVPTQELLSSSPSGDVEILAIEGGHSFPSQAPPCLDPLIDLRRRTGAFTEARQLETLRQQMWNRGPDTEAEHVERLRFGEMAWSDDSIDAHNLASLGWYYARKGRHAEAIVAFEDALRRIDRVVARARRKDGPEPFASHLPIILDLAEEYEVVGRLAEAERLLVRATDIASTWFNPRHHIRLETVGTLASLQSKSGRHREAEATWRRYLTMADAMRGPEHADYAFGLAGLAVALRGEGRLAEANAAQARADAIWNEEARRIAAVRSLPLPSVLQTLPPSAN